MLTHPCPPDDDDDDEPEATSSTRLIDDDADNRPAPTAAVRRRLNAVGGPSCSRPRLTENRQSTARYREPSRTSPSPTVRTETHDDEERCCCCCCCVSDVARAPPTCHCRCPATRRFYFRSSAFPSDDDADDDDESVCSCCQCSGADLHEVPTAAPQTGNELLPVASTRLSSVAPTSLLPGRGLNNSAVNGRLCSWSTAKDCGSRTVSTAGRLAPGGLASFFTFLRSRGRSWSSECAGSATGDNGDRWKRVGGRGSSTLPPCTCGLGVQFDPPLTVAQQVYPDYPGLLSVSVLAAVFRRSLQVRPSQSVNHNF